MRLQDLGFLIFAIVILSVATRVSAMEVDKSVLAQEQISRLDAFYRGHDAFCDAQNLHPDVANACKSQDVKKVTLDEVKQRVNLRIAHELEQGRVKVEVDRKEELCLEQAQKEAAKLGVEFNGNETCAELRQLIADFYEEAKSAGVEKRE